MRHLIRAAILLAVLVSPGVVAAQSPSTSKQLAVGTTCPNSCVTLDVTGMGSATVQVVGSGTYTLVVEGAANPAADFTTKALAPFAGGAQVTSITAAGGWTVNVSGLESLRVRKSAGTGTPTVYLRAAGAGGSGIGGDATESTLSTISTTIASILDRMAIDANFNDPVKATGSQIMAEIKTVDGSALPNSSGAEGSAVRPAYSPSGVGLQTLTDLAGLSSAIVLEDSASANLDALVRIACIRDDTLDARSGTEGDYEPCHLNANGALWTIDVNSASALTSLQAIDNLATDPCASTAKTFIPISISTATTTEITPSLAGSSTHYYICQVNLVTAAANNVLIADDDSDGCGSPTNGIFGSDASPAAGEGWNFGANGGIALGSGWSQVGRTQGTNRVICVITSAATQLSGGIEVVAAP